MYYYPGYARLPSYRGAHGKQQGINSCRYPFTTPGLRETIVDKMPCLGAHALSGTRTRDPLITSREHEPIHYSVMFWRTIPYVLVHWPAKQWHQKVDWTLQEEEEEDNVKFCCEMYLAFNLAMHFQTFPNTLLLWALTHILHSSS